MKNRFGTPSTNRIAPNKVNAINYHYINSEIESIQLANRLLNDPNNLVLWKCYSEKCDGIVFKYGFSCQWYKDMHGIAESFHGLGIYAFYKPDAAQKICNIGGIGDTILKGVLRGKFNNFLILDGDLAEEYYHSNDIRTQVDALYSNEAFKKEFISFYHNLVGDYHISNNTFTGHISKALNEKFGLRLRGGAIRGIVYNGKNEPHACVIYNPNDFVPVCVTNDKNLNASGRDFDNWEVKVTEETLEHINKFDDYYSHGERLLAEGRIKEYLDKPAIFGYLFVTLNNGRKSYYHTKTDRIISQFGFDARYDFQKNDSGMMYAECVIADGENRYDFYIVLQEGEYYVCNLDKETKTFLPIPQIKTIEEYDRVMTERTQNKITKAANYINPKPNKGGYTRNPSIPFQVTFPDGTVIAEKNASKTFIATLQKIGLKKVQEVNIDICGYNLVSDTQRPPQGKTKKWQDFVDGKYIYTKLGNAQKIVYLQQIAEALGINLKIKSSEENDGITMSPTPQPQIQADDTKPTAKQPRKGKTGLRITLSDGTIIQEKQAKDTFIKAIKAAGPAKLLDRRIDNAEPVVSKTRHSNPNYARAQHPIEGGFLVLTQFSTKRKKELLEKLGRMPGINMNWTVEIV